MMTVWDQLKEVCVSCEGVLYCVYCRDSRVFHEENRIPKTRFYDVNS